ncbi:ABC transporter permease [Falsigemmobacter intermedius]|uniref:ABC transporter permease n=1 Tax=Falsigemmobacter intermedius TaxID=1553448 RepID=A0A3S4XUN9_9RHOB|nr:ABC transporter permease [Falsigemmobacter intermedius]RWY42411.1 ABC transporter permease [Falsigemmobacter intermedius]
MFKAAESRKTGRLGSAISLLERIYHATVRNVRKSHGNAMVGLLLNVFQTVLLVGVFYIMFELLNMRRLAIRGDFLLYVMSGVFMFLTHTKAVGAVSGAEGPTSPMMKHAPMNTVISIMAAALSSLYLQVLSAAIVLWVYHAAVQQITIHNPAKTLGIFLLAWGSGATIGMVLLAAKPWWPSGVMMISTVYQRVNMIASGKMFVVNMLPGSMIGLFDWNPLFHCIDQARGAIFLNYEPRYTSLSYPVIVTLCCLMLGLMLEFYTRRHASLSWGAGK